MRYCELLKDRDEPLYHATSVAAALAIIIDDEIKGSTTQRLGAPRFQRLPQRIIDDCTVS
jgi:hypothetical protein